MSSLTENRRRDPTTTPGANLCVDTLQQSLLRASSFCRHCLPILQKHIHPGQEQYLCSCNKQPLHLKPVTEQLLLTMPLLAIYGRKKSETQLDAHRSFMFTPNDTFPPVSSLLSCAALLCKLTRIWSLRAVRDNPKRSSRHGNASFQ